MPMQIGFELGSNRVKFIRIECLRPHVPSPSLFSSVFGLPIDVSDDEIPLAKRWCGELASLESDPDNASG